MHGIVGDKQKGVFLLCNMASVYIKIVFHVNPVESVS